MADMGQKFNSKAMQQFSYWAASEQLWHVILEVRVRIKGLRSTSLRNTRYTTVFMFVKCPPTPNLTDSVYLR